MNFGRGEVAERLQCMSDLGFIGIRLYGWIPTIKMTEA